MKPLSALRAKFIRVVGSDVTTLCMKVLLEKYISLMHRSRAIGIFAAVLVFVSVLLVLSGVYISMAAAEVPFGHDLMWSSAGKVMVLILIGVSFVLRIHVLRTSNRRPYSQVTASWIVSSLLLTAYFWLMMRPSSPPEPICGSDGQCFTIYVHMPGADLVEIGALVFISASLLRSVVTFVYGASTYRYK